MLPLSYRFKGGFLMEKLITILNKEVANFGILYTKLHNFHWFIKGDKFFELHEKFEELYDEVTEHFDAVAERILMLGDKPKAKLTTLKEATGSETTNEMVEAIINDFTIVINELEAAIELSDKVTEDLLLGIQASLEKHRWMLKTYLV
jgi:starvation-inducible DNA-binding protein